jgi:penicillin-binding protein 1A
MITRIEDKNGKIIFQETPLEKVALSPVANYVMVEMLKHVTSGAGGFGNTHSIFGGKTGTTNDAADGWFMAINPQLVTGIWVGGEDKWITFLDTNEGQGAFMARPMFAKFLENLEKNQNIVYNPALDFKKPEGEITIELDCYKYQLSGIDLENTSKNAAIYEDAFDEGGKKTDEFIE